MSVRTRRRATYICVPDPTPVPGGCGEAEHTPAPVGYLAWHEWAERMAETHVQQRCPACGRWAVWIPKELTMTDTEAGRAPACTCTPLNRKLMAYLLNVDEGSVHEQACVENAAAEAAARALAEVRERLRCEDPEEPCDTDGRDEHRWCDNCIARAAIEEASHG